MIDIFVTLHKEIPLPSVYTSHQIVCDLSQTPQFHQSRSISKVLNIALLVTLLYNKKKIQTACYTNFLSLDRRIEMIKKRRIHQMKMHWSNSIRCLKSLENLLSAKPILRWREVPAQETKYSDNAKDDACLKNTSDEQVINKKVKSDWRSWKWQR